MTPPIAKTRLPLPRSVAPRVLVGSVLIRSSLLRSLAVGLLAVSITFSADAAAGSEGGPDEVESWINDRTLLVTAGTQSSLTITRRPRAGTGRAITCGWFLLDLSTVDIGVYQLSEPEIGRNYLLWCWYSDDRESLTGHPIVAEYTGTGMPGEPADADEVSEFALASMEFIEPSPVLSPSSTQIVGIESWLAISSQLDYDPIHANAGPVWVSVRPKFRDVVWDLGNGDSVTCTSESDATTIWNPALAERSREQSSECTYTYETYGHTSGHTSGGDGGLHQISATVTWTILRRTFTQPVWQRWRDFSLTTTRTILVRDLQAVID